MKCIVCANRPTMEERYGNHTRWWECPVCHATIGKKEEEEKENVESKSNE